MDAISNQSQTVSLPSPVAHRCAVVGNSGILLGSLCGKEIDDHDFIFRTNLAPIGGIDAEDVGSRVDIVSINRVELTKLWKRATQGDFWVHPIGLMLIDRLKSVTNSTTIWYPKGFPEKLRQIAASFRDDLELHPKWAYSLESLMYLASRVWSIPVPSTGLSVLTAALLHCDEVDMYGFYPFPRDSRGRPVQYHYYEPDQGPFYSKRNTTIGVHKMPKEFAVLKFLDAEGALRLVTERCYDEA